MDSFELEIKNAFLQEASQLLEEAEQCFLELEANPGSSSILEKIFRLAHNLKGSAKAVGFDQLGDFTHELESFLLKLKNGEITAQPAIVSLLLRCNDYIVQLINALKENPAATIDYADLLLEIETFKSGQGPSAVEQSKQTELSESGDGITTLKDVPEASQFETHDFSQPLSSEASEEIVIEGTDSHSKLEVLNTENVVELRQNLQSEKPVSPQQSSSAPTTQKADESIRVSLSRVERLLNFVGEMVILQTVLREQEHSGNNGLLKKTIHQLGKVTKEVQDISMSLRMIPLKQTFQKMQRIVRDTSSNLNKKVNFHISGEDTEIDKTILENIGDPLVHLIRNAVDHGIEDTERRRESGKSEIGTIHLKAFHQGGNLIIEVSDDGAGMDAQKLKNKAIEKGLIKPNAVMSEQDCYQLVFLPGFSTKAVVTDVSGRGVGMDVVRTNIEALQGDIIIETGKGKGTTFKVLLPLTLAIIDGMVVRAANERYVIPLSHVHESVRPQEKDIHWITGMGDILCLRGENLPIFPLSQLLGRKGDEKKAWESNAVVIRVGNEPFAVLVDEIVGQQQVVIKQLGAEHRELKGFSGSAILGDGRPALILELQELAVRNKGKGTQTNQKQELKRMAV